MAKGADFERELCKKLSLWWTDDERDDVFWRTAGSGGRATMRGRKGASTYGQDGDIQAVDPVGKPLMDLVTIELKRGYAPATFADILEPTKKGTTPMYLTFFEQAIRSAKNAGSVSWWLIVRRDHRASTIFFPRELAQSLLDTRNVVPFAAMRFTVEPEGMKKHDIQVGCMALDEFLFRVTADDIQKALRIARAGA
jgi:hypothetical protein